jgi:hypothetical protein
MQNKYQLDTFKVLPQYSFFGEYQLMYDLKSNIVFKTTEKEEKTIFMCVSKKDFLNLCDLFPKSTEILRRMGLERRDHWIETMIRLDDHSPIKAIRTKINKKMNEYNTQKSKGEAVSMGIGVFSALAKYAEDFSGVTVDYANEDPYFFSDEEAVNDIKAMKMDIHGFVTKISHRVEDIIKSF